MRRRLIIYTTLISCAGLLCFFAVSVYNTYTNNLRHAENTIVETTQICANLYKTNTDPSEFVRTGNDTRITIIASNGSVIADSSPLDFDRLESHLDRPEIQAAANDLPAVYSRYSETLGTNYLYYAMKVGIDSDDSGSYVFVRTSIPIDKLDTYLSQSLPVLILLFIVVALLCFILTRGVVNRISKPLETIKEKLNLLSEGRFTHIPMSGQYSEFEEIDAIVCEIDDVAQVLQTNIEALQEEKNKAEYILNNISDAIIAVNSISDIVLVNNAAQNVLGITPEVIGKNINYLTGNKELLDAINDCVNQGNNALSEIFMTGRTYILTVKQLENTTLTMVILSDITASRESAKLREEFFENASHELKTPLTAIRGFNELCTLNNTDPKLAKYIEGIERETGRMLTLIGDMLRLSELSHSEQLNPVSVSLYDIASEIGEMLSVSIKEKELKFEIAGDGIDVHNCAVSAEPEHIFELMKNLIENAVRYNNQNGSITVTLGQGSLKVSDTGIGIALEAQTRLFERFYRVEKSRSIQSGGTGLGLSIVKHICNLYGWNLTLKSRPAIGTDVTVLFS